MKFFPLLDLSFRSYFQLAWLLRENDNMCLNSKHSSHISPYIVHTSHYSMFNNTKKGADLNSSYTLQFTYLTDRLSFYLDETLVFIQKESYSQLALSFSQELPAEISLPSKNFWTSQQHACRYYWTSQLLFKDVILISH